ncbi:glycosyltransferase [Geomonas nitrogeniifigens]|uniref:Glycosyltransferase n=1 Tax=Geomonas diazotrophica TaxID=2843197 RepID=A0ABX8JC07_9BACT|nr:glycosyltransferase [Geomonas nitrogeniifigens]QWV95963.1 glycosyltransferase [Geomonas nitrogeniifigens]
MPVIYLPFYDRPIITHLATMLSLCCLLLRVTGKKSVLIYYNYTIHFCFGLMLTRLMGRRCLIDIEDGYRPDDRNIRNLPNYLLLWIYNRLCNGGAMLASTGLRQQTSSDHTYVCYGVSQPTKVEKDWNQEPLQVLLGGSLLPDTGAELLVEALRLLKSRHSDDAGKLSFVVTGFGECAEQFQQLAAGEMSDLLTFHGAVTDWEYSSILQQSHIGLCLKLPCSSMGTTTFPSKTVELVSNGLLLVSTKVSDVPVVFSEDTAVLLREATAECLVSELLALTRDAERCRRIAEEGQNRVASLLAPAKVADDLLKFWQASGQLPGQPLRDF